MSFTSVNGVPAGIGLFFYSCILFDYMSNKETVKDNKKEKQET